MGALEQVPSAVPYRSNSIEPSGLTPPESRPESLSTIPTVPPAEGVVVRAGGTGVVVVGVTGGVEGPPVVGARGQGRPAGGGVVGAVAAHAHRIAEDGR